MRGWQLRRQPLFAGGRYFFTLSRNGQTIGPLYGATLAEVATDLFLEAMRRQPHSPPEDTLVRTPPGAA